MSEQLAVCRASIAAHSKSFYLASRLLPARQSDQAAAIYAWCRRADDAVDESPEASSCTLDVLRRELNAVYRGELMSDPVLASFQRVVMDCAIPEQYPSELLDGMAMDVTGFQYTTWDDLFVYCYRVASTVGLMMCRVMGVSSDRALPHAVDLGVAMQLTNIARDVGEDWRRERLYLPDELLVEHGLGGLRSCLGTPLTDWQRDLLRPVLRQVLDVADRYYASADRGLGYLSLRHRFGVAAARWIYSDIGRSLRRTDCDALGERAVVPTLRKLALLVKAAAATILSARGAEGAPRPLLRGGNT